MAMADELARGEGRRHEFSAVDDRVEAAFEKPDQVLRGVALEARRLLIDVLELALIDVGVIAFQLLFGAKLHAEIRQLAGAALAVLAGAVFALVDRAFRAAPNVLAEAAVDLVLGADALGHSRLQRDGFR